MGRSADLVQQRLLKAARERGFDAATPEELIARFGWPAR